MGRTAAYGIVVLTSRVSVEMLQKAATTPQASPLAPIARADGHLSPQGERLQCAGGSNQPANQTP